MTSLDDVFRAARHALEEGTKRAWDHASNLAITTQPAQAMASREALAATGNALRSLLVAHRLTRQTTPPQHLADAIEAAARAYDLERRFKRDEGAAA